MAQHDYNIANGSGLTVRNDINDALSAVVSLNSGPTAPSTTVAYMLWYDTTAAQLKIRNADNSGWVSIGLLSGSAFNVLGNAATVTNGVYTTGNQTIAGVKTFSSSPVLPTPPTANNSTEAATTAYVISRVANDAPTKTGGGASGTWGINITGNAATVTNGITTGNIGSYAPGLTGGGASGNWAISITGNAATATTATTANNAIGQGQTWQTVSRSVNTWYQNTTGRPIMIAAQSTGSYAQLLIGVSTGSYITVAYNNAPGSGNYEQDFFTSVVPNNWYYYFVGGSYNSFVELR